VSPRGPGSRPHSVKARQRKHDRVHDQGRHADLPQGLGCRATDRLQPRVTGALDSHVTGSRGPFIRSSEVIRNG
jgi:hypothetical protein